MPKKFIGENTKAVQAKARKTAAKEAETSRKQQQIEDEYWRDDNKNNAKKQQRKEEQEKRKQQQLDRKAEAKALLEQEMSSIKKISKVIPPPKITRAQITAIAEKKLETTGTSEDIDTHLNAPLEENINRVSVDGAEARNIDEAISILSLKEGNVDKHPERRMKAAYTAFEERRLKELKEENPTLRLSQLKQLIFKEWQKSPENPLINIQ